MLQQVRDHDLSIYLKAQGGALALGGYEQNPEFWEEPKKDFSFGLFDLDWDTFLQVSKRCIHHHPFIIISNRRMHFTPTL